MEAVLTLWEHNSASFVADAGRGMDDWRVKVVTRRPQIVITIKRELERLVARGGDDAARETKLNHFATQFEAMQWRNASSRQDYTERLSRKLKEMEAQLPSRWPAGWHQLQQMPVASASAVAQIQPPGYGQMLPPQRQGEHGQIEQMAERLELEGVAVPMLHALEGGDLPMLRDLAAAELLLRETLEAQCETDETIGAQHPDTLKSICNLSMLLQDKGDLAAANFAASRDPSTLSNMSKFGGLKGDLDAAEPLLREVLETQRQTLGARHPDTLASMNSLGMLLYDKGELAAAEPLLREAKRWWSL